MRIALTRQVSRSLSECEVTWIERTPIDIDRAAAQHAAYRALLERHGCTVLTLPAQNDLPDAVFVEDPVVVLDEIAVLLQSGALSRRPEVLSLVPVLEPLREIRRIDLPGTIDGGDVLQIGRTLYAGRSSRTNAAGIAAFAAATEPFGYRVVPVRMRGCLHLKSGCTYTGRDVLINPDWIDGSAFEGESLLPVPASEPGAADILRLDECIVMADTFPATAALVRDRGHDVDVIDVSEFQKAEAGVTCLSVIFEAGHLPPSVQAYATALRPAASA